MAKRTTKRVSDRPDGWCSTPRCRGAEYLTYLGRPLCETCWQKHCADAEKELDEGQARTLRMRLAAPRMFDALKRIHDRWERGQEACGPEDEVRTQVRSLIEEVERAAADG